MKKRRLLKDRILVRISLKKDSVFLRSDFKDLGGYDQVGRALREAVREKKLIKIGYGLYAKTKKSKITARIMPEAPLPELAQNALIKLNVKIRDSRAKRDYNSGASTQVPTGRTIAVIGRVERKIGYNGAYINYERVTTTR